MSICVTVNCHPHPVVIKYDKNPWYCDSLTLGNECGRKHTENLTIWPYKRYLCTEGCNFSLCDMCAFEHLIDEKPEIFLETSVHEHPLKFFKNIPIAWYCDLVHNEKGCTGNHKSCFEYRDQNVYICLKCEFYLCDKDAKLYDNNSKNDFQKSSKTMNKTGKIKKLEENLAKITVLVNFHPHKLLLQHDDGKWYCDSLTSNKKCQRKQSESTIQWPYKRYQCVEGCDFCVCDWCAYKYQINEDPTSFIDTSVHEHPLQYFSNIPIEWYCDMVETETNCQRNHKNVLEYRDQNVCICQKCNFFLCDLDVEKYKIKTNSSHASSKKKTSTSQITEDNDNDLDLYDSSILKKNYGEKLKIIGKGSFGIVFLAEKGPNEKVAVKIIETFDQDQLNENIRELLNLTRLKGHPNIISSDKYYVSSVLLSNQKLLNQILIEMEYADENLLSMIKEAPNHQIEQKKLIKILKQIGNGLAFAHERDCVHLDLKPENILVVDSVYKIADWGGSLILKDGEKGLSKEENVYFTYSFAAPEIIEQLEKKTFGKEKINLYKCDVYSFGLVIFKCCGVRMKDIKKIPRDKDGHDIAVNQLLENLVSQNYSFEFCKLINKLCKYNPKSRPTIIEFLSILNSIK